MRSQSRDCGIGNEGNSGSGILPLIERGKAAKCCFHYHTRFAALFSEEGDWEGRFESAQAVSNRPSLDP